ncbi:Carboxylic ester hydrolase [Mycena sanguinolenta]|uniref:Carboxylic ester hydrolase n=1 Tax=Mycena sanguinolenta TaxID=230812 RepID=A0A8H6Y8Z1_9AGAR|nr:Carboxylic ester hydrolase [Mycena sanguinolenta]
MFFPSQIVFAAAFAVLVDAAALSTVTLDYGTFTGLTDTTTGIIYFRGVRYADPPVGDLRWRAAVSPPTTPLGNVNATTFGDACIATSQTAATSSTSEDCLFGNVYIPISTTASSALPVLIYFYGGGFESGSSNGFAPENLLQPSTEPLIFVTFNYRLGQFGFLSGTPVHDDGLLNAGLLDQGDSPSLSFLPHYNDTFAENLFAQFAGFAGCSGTGSAIMACLRAAPTNTLALAGSQILANRSSSFFPLAPIADGSFIQERPVEAFRSGNFARVPVLFGQVHVKCANWCQGLANPAANTANPNANETTVYNCIAGQFSTFTTESYQTALTLYPLADYNNSFQLQGQQMYGEMRYICSALLITGAAQNFRYGGLSIPLGQSWANSDLQPRRGAVIDAMRLYFTSFATSGAPVAANSAAWTPSADINGSPRILLHPSEVAMENITDALAARCDFWHGLSSEINT